MNRLSVRRSRLLPVWLVWDGGRIVAASAVWSYAVWAAVRLASPDLPHHY